MVVGMGMGALRFFDGILVIETGRTPIRYSVFGLLLMALPLTAIVLLAAKIQFAGIRSMLSASCTVRTFLLIMALAVTGCVVGNLGLALALPLPQRLRLPSFSAYAWRGDRKSASITSILF